MNDQHTVGYFWLLEKTPRVDASEAAEIIHFVVKSRELIGVKFKPPPLISEQVVKCFQSYEDEKDAWKATSKECK